MASLENLLSQGVIERLGWMLVHMLWQAAVVSLLLAGLLRLLRGAGANLRYLAACAALALIVALPVATVPFIAVAGPAAAAGPSLVIRPPAVAPPTAVQVVDQMPAFSGGPAPLETLDRTMPVSWRARIASTVEPVLPYLVLGWLVGVFGLSAWHLGGWAQLQRLKRRMVHGVGRALQTRLAELGARLGIHRAVALLQSAIVEVPTVVGWLRPVILLPASVLTSLSPDQLEALLAHELAHIRRHDYLVNILQTVVEILGFYHPAVWWVSHRIRVERENCCDDVAVRTCGDSVRYAEALTCMEEIRHRGPALAVAASGGSLLARITRLLGRPATTDRHFAWLPGLIALLLVAGLIIPAALVLAAPDGPLAGDRVDSEPNDSGQAHDILATEAATQAPTGNEQHEPVQILINFSLFPEISPHKTVDRETRLLIGEILAPENPQVSNEIAGAGSLGEILRTWVAGKHLATETIEVLIDVLQSRGYVGGEATPQVLVNNDKQAQINMITEEVFLPSTDPASSPKLIELGTFVQVTPHLSSLASDRITLEMVLECRDRAKQDDPSDTPTVRVTEIASTVTIPRNRYFTLLIEPDNAGNAETVDSEFMLFMFRADRHETGAKQEGPSIAQVQPSDSHPRQVLLDVRVVVTERQDLALPGVEWGYPTTRAGAFPDTTPGMGVRMGYTPDRAFTDRLLATLNRLQETGQASIIAHPQLLAQEGRESRVKAVTEEWFALAVSATDETSPTRRELVKVDSGTIISVTPHLGDANDIILDMTVELSESIPRGKDADLPVVTRRTSRSTVTIRDGGTVALAGLKENQVGEDKSAREVAIFVTAHLVRETSQIAQPSSQGEEMVLPISPAGNASSDGSPGESEAPASGSSPQQIVDARREYVNSDPVFRELARQSVEIERELIADGHKLAPGNPAMVRKRAILDALKKRMDERKENLRQEFDEQLAERSETRAGVQSHSAAESPITAAYTDADLQAVLADISKRVAVSIRTDDTVKSQAVTVELVGASVEEALHQILDGTPYAFKKLGEARNAQPEQARITMTFLGDELRPVLQDLAEAAGVPILADETVVGQVYAEMKDISLDKALEMVMAGTPYVVKRTPDYYLVTTGRGLSGLDGRRIADETPNPSPSQRSAYLVYRPIQMRCVNYPQREALMDVAAMAGVSVVLGDNVTGDVSAELQDATLDTAFCILLAGTPYSVEKKADQYHIVDRRTTRGKAATTTGRRRSR